MAAPSPGLQKIDFKNLKPREVAVLVFSALALLGFGWYKFDYQKLEMKKGQVEKKLKDVEVLVSSFRQAVISPEQKKQIESDIAKVGNEMQEIRAEIEDIKGRMSAKSVNILQQLKKEAGSKGTVLRSFKTTEKKAVKGKYTYKEISILMKIESEYDSISRLVGKFEDLPAFLNLKKLETERVEEILPIVESLLSLELVVF